MHPDHIDIILSSNPEGNKRVGRLVILYTLTVFGVGMTVGMTVGAWFF